MENRIFSFRILSDNVLILLLFLAKLIESIIFQWLEIGKVVLSVADLLLG